MVIIKSFFFYASIFLILVSCTFDYGEKEQEENKIPDLIMENVEYIRVRSSDPIARFTAERAERYEHQGIMIITNFTFEQFGEKGSKVNAFGAAGYASVNIETSDIFMDNGVNIEVESEEIIIKTRKLDWKDKEKKLSTGSEDEVTILQHNGTDFVGIGLLADARRRTWEFLGNVSGKYIYNDESEENEPKPKKVKSEKQINDLDYDEDNKTTQDIIDEDTDELWVE